MRKIARNCSKILAGLLLTVLLAACGSKAETTAISSTAPDPGGVYSQSVAISSSGSIYSWGVNIYGQLGNGVITAKSTPEPVLAGAAGTGDLTGMKGVSAGGTHTLAFGGADDTVYAWGNNGFGQLGDNSIIARTKPVKVRINATDTTAFLTGITAVAAGGNHSLALKDGAVWAWGNNRQGQLGLGEVTTLQRNFAEPVTSLANITMIAAGGSYSLALDNDKTVWSWGLNASGQLGQGLGTTPIPTPAKVSSLTGVTHIAAGGSHSLFVNSVGVWACGLNNYGQLGEDVTTEKEDVVVLVTGLPAGLTPIAVAAGLDHSLARMNDGTVYAWGYNRYGQLGNPTKFNTDTAVTSPVKVMVDDITALSDVKRIVAIGNHSLAVDNNGHLWAWGENTYGQLGNGKKIDSPYAIDITAITGITGLDLYMP